MNNIIVNSTIISIKVSLISVLITFFISITFIYFNSYKKNKKKSIMDILILLPMFIPPSAIGYIILITLGKNSFIGVILEKYFNIRIIFTIQACIIASVIVTLPLMYQSIKTSIFAIDQDIINASKLDGASDFKIFTKIILPLCKNGIYSGILLSFARSLGEFGATILVAGNIPGKTQTLPMAMYNAIEANQTKTTIIILFVILSILILVPVCLSVSCQPDFHG